MMLLLYDKFKKKNIYRRECQFVIINSSNFTYTIIIIVRFSSKQDKLFFINYVLNDRIKFRIRYECKNIYQQMNTNSFKLTTEVIFSKGSSGSIVF